MEPIQKTKFDKNDLKIASALRCNAKLSYKSLGAMVNLSPPSVHRRIKKMEEEGAIVDYRAEIDYKKFGYSLHAYILLKDDNVKRDANEQLCRLEEVCNCWVVSGEYDYMIEVYLPSNKELSELIDKLYDVVGRTYTLLIIRQCP